MTTKTLQGGLKMLQAIVIGLGGILGFLAIVGASLFIWDFFCFEEPSQDEDEEEKLD